MMKKKSSEEDQMEVREGGRLTSRMILGMYVKWAGYSANKYPALKIPGYRLSGRLDIQKIPAAGLNIPYLWIYRPDTCYPAGYWF